MAPAMTRRRKAQQDLKAETASSDDTNQKHDLPVRAKDEDVVKAPAQGTMMVFGDDDNLDVPAPVKAKVAAPVEEEEDEEGSDDDEAPEAVSTTKAASDAIKSSQAATKAAQKAAQEKAVAQKRKRRQQDALFKQQASERKKTQVEDSQSEDGSADEAETQTKSLLQSRKAPNLLPAEFLTDSSSEDEQGSDEDGAESAPRPRKRRVGAVERSLARQGRGPRDERVGSTVYRVAGKVDERMAPKAKKQAKNSRDLLLKRNKSVTKQRSGFFVK